MTAPDQGLPALPTGSALRPYRGFSGGDKTLVVYRGPDKHPDTGVLSRFYLSGRYKGKQNVELAPGLIGLDRPPSELVWLQEARQNGADLVGSNLDVRTIKGAVNILGSSPRDFRAGFAAWNRAQRLEEYGRLVFINSYSGYRWLDVLLGEAPLASIDKEPVLRRGLVGYPFTWVCPNPFFKGRVEEFTNWTQTQVDAGWRRGKIRVRNLGDAVAYPQIWLPGPTGSGSTTWRIPSGFRYDDSKEMINPNEYIELPPITAGQEIWVDTNPRNQTIDMHSADGKVTNLWAKMKGRRPRLHLPGEHSEDWNISCGGALVSDSPKVVVQPLYSSYQ